ncbi:hypothetical protein SAMN04488509_101609 [Aquimonas voraii]|uniref:Uncharacterized protein n=1 Tax=Aquimonas voraii TaxID=265719 RepID=A0A1G6SQI8_9GAMM|nr:hypothetical protein SAMN04488509_101609 [Aquimonas voraii]
MRQPIGWALAHRSPTLASVKALGALEPLAFRERLEGAHWPPVAADIPGEPCGARFKPLSPWERGWGEGRAEQALRASPSITTRLLPTLQRAGARALPGAPGERREAVDPPAGSPAGMPAMFVTVQGCTVHEHPRAHANPERRDARRARTRGGLSLAYLSLATQRKVGRAGRRSDRKLLIFASSGLLSKRRTSKEPSRRSWRDSERALRPAPSPTPPPMGEGLRAPTEPRMRQPSP